MVEEEDRNLLRQSCMDKDSTVEENQIISLDWQQLAVTKINRFNNVSALNASTDLQFRQDQMLAIIKENVVKP